MAVLLFVAEGRTARGERTGRPLDRSGSHPYMVPFTAPLPLRRERGFVVVWTEGAEVRALEVELSRWRHAASDHEGRDYVGGEPPATTGIPLRG